MEMSTSIHSWHLFYACSKEKSKMSLSYRFRQMQSSEEVENADAVSKCCGGGGQPASQKYYKNP